MQVYSNEVLATMYATSGQSGDAVAADSKGRLIVTGAVTTSSTTSSVAVTPSTTGGFELMTSLTGAAILTTYVAIKTTSFPTRTAVIVNRSDRDIIVAAPGSSGADHLYVPTLTTLTVDFVANGTTVVAGTWQIKATPTAATTGSVYFSSSR